MKVKKIRFKNLITLFQTEPTHRERLSPQGTIFSPFCTSMHYHPYAEGRMKRNKFKLLWKKLVRKFQRSMLCWVTLVVDKKEKVGNLFKTTWNTLWESLVLLSRVIWNGHLMCVELDINLQESHAMQLHQNNRVILQNKQDESSSINLGYE